MTRLLGIDLGARRIGLAVADTQARTVRPLATIRRSSAERDRATIARLAAEQRIAELVMGLPLNMDGSEGEQASVTRAWAAEALADVGLPVHWRDERLTSERAAARLPAPRRGRAGGPPSAARRGAHRAAIDRHAATLILEAELEARDEVATEVAAEVAAK